MSRSLTDELNLKARKGRRFKIKKERCANCGYTKDLEIHHIKLKAWGGTNHPRNYMILCKRCHKNIHREHTSHCLDDVFLEIRKNIMKKNRESCLSHYNN